MILFANRRAEKAPAFSLIELSLVVSVLLGLASLLLVGVGAYKEGANRANCIQNVAKVQRALRIHSNYAELSPGSAVKGLKETLIAPEAYLPAAPVCPSEGEYLFVEERVPQIGELFMQCSIPDHQPKDIRGW